MKRPRRAGQRVTEGDAGMGQPRRVDDDEVGVVLRRRVHALDELVLAVALEGLQTMAEELGLLREEGVDLGQAHGPVVLRLAGAEEIEVRPVQNQDCRHRISLAVRMNPVTPAIGSAVPGATG